MRRSIPILPVLRDSVVAPSGAHASAPLVLECGIQ
jgi:hypothetical protein